MHIEALTHQHIIDLDLQPEQAGIADELKSEKFFKEITLSQLPSYAVVAGGQVLGCYGTQLLWPGRGMAWALLSKKAGQHMNAIHTVARGYIESLGIARVEAYVRTGFKPGVRWVELLGFVHEGHMQKFFANGEDAELYAKVRA